MNFLARNLKKVLIFFLPFAIMTLYIKSVDISSIIIVKRWKYFMNLESTQIETNNVKANDSKSSKSNAPIVCFGVASLIGVAFLTFIATKAVVNKINDNANIAYAESYNRYQASLQKQSEVEEQSSLRDITNYTSNDLVQIDDEWYICLDLVSDDGKTEKGDAVPITVDLNDTISIGDSDYVHILSLDSMATANSGNEVPYFGSEYVVVDIDGNMVYLVNKGDTLSDVSGKVGYSVQELAAFNGIDDVNLIYTGQTLRVPAPQEAIDYVKANPSESSIAD